jgi:pre-rRNA-processing protein TSR2
MEPQQVLGQKNFSSSSSVIGSASSNAANLAVMEFHAGVTAVLRSWSALKTAVMQEWGGDDSYKKAESLRSLILEQYSNSSSCVMEVYDLEDNLNLYMEEEFCLWLEDNSERHVAQVIVQMYEQCRQGVFTLSREMVAVAEHLRLQQEGYSAPTAMICQDDDDDDDDEEEESIMRATTNNNNNYNPSVSTTTTDPSMATHNNNSVVWFSTESITPTVILEYATGSLFGNQRTTKSNEASNRETKVTRQLGEPELPPTIEEPMDEDGFTVVIRKNRK